MGSRHEIASDTATGSEPDTSPGDARPAGAAHADVAVHQSPHRTGRAPTHRVGARWAGLGALGVVYGDIATSPLYALRTAFSMEHNAVPPDDPRNVYGIVSMVLWTITLVVTVKYVLLMTRADNEGEGGVMALAALLRRHLGNVPVVAGVAVLGMLGASLFYGDAVITPAISVLSAVEGLTVVSPGLAALVVPVAVIVLAALFLVQPGGTGAVARAFGPLMLLWCVVMALLAVPHIVAHPQILASFSPHWAIELVARHPGAAFVLLGAVVLTVTGAEALYADLGHFGRRAIRQSWMVVVLPALVLTYLGQGALIAVDPRAAANPFFEVAPPALRLPLVVLATAATIIASQAVISGTFSVTRQAVRLGLLPRLTVRHTSRRQEGQIYVPAVNWLLLGGVLVLVVQFSSSEALASAYGLAVTGTLVLDSALFLILATRVWGWSRWKVGAYIATVGVLEVVLFSSSTPKLLQGAWLPLVIGGVIMLVMTTWQWGYGHVREVRRELEPPLDGFITSLHAGVRRVPGVAVYPHPTADSAPLAMVRNVAANHVLHQHVVIVSVVSANVPHVRPQNRVDVHDLGFVDDGIVHVAMHVGFAETPDIPAALALAVGRTPELDIELEEALYFLSVLTLRTGGGRLSWRRRLFLTLERNQANRTALFHLPPSRTIVVGSEIYL